MRQAYSWASKFVHLAQLADSRGTFPESGLPVGFLFVLAAPVKDFSNARRDERR